MWYPATITVDASAEPVSAAEVRLQARVDGEDAYLALLIAAARGHVESYCAVHFAARTVTVKCDRFADFAVFPVVPLSGVTSITYLDDAGATQTLSTSVYEVRTDGMAASIALKYNQSWPNIQSGSRITVTATVGYAATPPAVKHAILLLVADYYNQREDTTVDRGVTPATIPNGIAALLANHRNYLTA